MTLRKLPTGEEPSLGELNELLEISERLLKTAWGNPSKLGVGSSIEIECYAHWADVIKLNIPTPPDRFAIYRRTVWLAWYACWRARDYSLPGWVKKVEAAEAWNSKHQSDFRNLLTTGVTHLGIVWPHGHVPIFDQFGDQVSPPSSRMNGKDYYPAHPIFYEGWMIGQGNHMDNFFPNADCLSWTYFSPGVKFSRQAVRDSWLAGGDFPENSALDRIVVDKSVHQKSAIGTGSSWSDILFFDRADLEFNCDVPHTLLGAVKAADNFVLTQPKGSKFSITLDGIRTIPSLEVRSPESSPLNLKVSNCHMKLKVIGGGEAQSPPALYLAHSNVEVILEGMNGASIQVEDCSISLRINNSKISTANVGNSDVELHSENFPRTYSLHLYNSSFNALRLINCKIDSFGSAGDNTVGSLQIIGSHFEKPVFLKNLMVGSEVKLLPSKENTTQFRDNVDLSCSGNSADKHIPYAEVRCEFFGDLDLNNREFSGTSDFSDSIFHRKLLVHGAVLHQDTNFSDTHFLWKESIEGAEINLAKKQKLNSLSNSYRSLRQAMERNNAAHDVQKFHLLQMRTRNHLKYGSADFSERLLGNAYDIISEYGTNILRPVYWLLFVFSFSWILYFCAVPKVGNVTEISSGAFVSTFRPFSTFGSSYSDMFTTGICFESGYEVIAYLHQNYEPWFSVLSFFQSVIVILLIFLLLLAIRRKYQLS